MSKIKEYRSKLKVPRTLKSGDVFKLEVGGEVIWEYTHQEDSEEITFTHAVIVKNGDKILEGYCE